MLQHWKTGFEVELLAPRGRSRFDLAKRIAGLRGGPDVAGYAASKYAVVGFARSLRDELAGTGVDVRALCPPPGDTPMIRNLPYRPKAFKLVPTVTAESVVQAALDGIETRDFILLVDGRSRLMMGLQRWAPDLIDKVIVRTLRA